MSLSLRTVRRWGPARYRHRAAWTRTRSLRSPSPVFAPATAVPAPAVSVASAVSASTAACAVCPPQGPQPPACSAVGCSAGAACPPHGPQPPPVPHAPPSAAAAMSARCRGRVASPHALHLEARVLDHVEVGLAGLALTGQVVAQEDRVGDVQAQRLQRAQVDLASARDPHLDVGADEADHRQDPQAALRGEVPLLGQRGALERDEEVDRYRVRAQLAQREDHVDQVAVALAHARDQAGAGGQARAVRLLHGVHPVRVGVGGGDVPVGALGGVEVVVVRVGAGRPQPLGLVVGEQAEAGADLDGRVGVLDGRDGVGHPVDVTVRRAAAAGHQADPLGAAA